MCERERRERERERERGVMIYLLDPEDILQQTFITNFIGQTSKLVQVSHPPLTNVLKVHTHSPHEHKHRV